MNFIRMFPHAFAWFIVIVLIASIEPIQGFIGWAFLGISIILGFLVFAYVFTLAYAWKTGWVIKNGQVLGRKVKNEVVK